MAMSSIDMLPPMKLSPAIRHFFGKDRLLRDFIVELQKLTYQDLCELKAGLEKLGYTIVE